MYVSFCVLPLGNLYLVDEVLERTKEQLEDDDSVGRAERNADDDFTKNIDSVLEEAKLDLDKINDGLDSDLL